MEFMGGWFTIAEDTRCKEMFDQLRCHFLEAGVIFFFSFGWGWCADPTQVRWSGAGMIDYILGGCR